ncbi:APC family permease [Streptomyces humidus]|uniref:APC family permease n=1 Tax=Streptomyces humidus TaxID=52259 RepID=UPI00332561B3
MSRSTPAQTPQAATTEATLRRDSIGAGHLVFFTVAAAAPLTVLAGFAPLAFMVGGTAVPAGFAAAGLVYLLFAVGFTTMARHAPGAGAFYAYISHGLGKAVGAGAAAIAYLGYLGGQIGFTASAGLFAATAGQTLFGVSPHWLVCALSITILVGYLGHRRVDIGARVLAGLLIAEVAVLAVFCVAVLLRGGHEGISVEVFTPSAFATTTIGGVFVIAFVAFVGFEQTAIYSEEVRDKRRTVPRATYLAVAFLAVAYTFCSWVIWLAAGPHRLGELLAGDPSTLVLALGDEYMGEVMVRVMQVLLVTSFVAGVLALHNATTRYLHTMGKSGILPAALGQVNARTGTPGVAGLFQAGVVLAALAVFGLAGADPYTQIIPWTNTPTLIGVVLLQIATSVAVVRYFRHPDRRTLESSWHRLLAPVLSAVLLTAALTLIFAKMGLLTGMGHWGNLFINLPLVAAFAVVALRERRRTRAQASWITPRTD